MDIYQKKFKNLTDKEKEVLSVSIQTLKNGDTLWHDNKSVWAWALMFIEANIALASREHPQSVMYVEYLKDGNRYGISIVRPE